MKLTTISGFQAPTSPTVHINAGQLKEITFTYAAEDPPPAFTSASSASGTLQQAGVFSSLFTVTKDGVSATAILTI